MRPGGSYRGKTGHASLWWARRFMTHSVISPPSYDALRKARRRWRQRQLSTNITGHRLMMAGQCHEEDRYWDNLS
jgi:hypothetical protein